MSVHVSIDLPESVFSSLKQTPESFVTEMRVAAAVKWYETGMVSQSKGAEIAGLSRQEFMDALVKFKVSPFQTTSEELTQEFARD